MKISGIGKLRCTARQIKNLLVPRALILLYHRVSDLPSDPQLLCVSRRHFAEHLEILRKYSGVVTLNELGRVLRYGNRKRRLLAVTFDDGYADNLYHGKTLLERYNVPATVFVTAGYAGSGKEFWHDDLEKLFLQPGTLPERLCFEVNGHSYQWQLGESAYYDERSYQSHCAWNVLRQDDPTRRHELYRSIVKILFPLPDAERRSVVDRLLAWGGLDTNARASHRLLSPEEIALLAEAGLVEIGSHTMTHPMLAGLPRAAQVEEISLSKTRLEEILSHPIASFAYPYGTRKDYTDETVAAVRQAGFDCACSNFVGIASPRTDPWQLPRFLIRDWDGEVFSRNLAAWFGD